MAEETLEAINLEAIASIKEDMEEIPSELTTNWLEDSELKADLGAKVPLEPNKVDMEIKVLETKADLEETTFKETILELTVTVEDLEATPVETWEASEALDFHQQLTPVIKQQLNRHRLIFKSVLKKL
jgi:hypothetical protein